MFLHPWAISIGAAALAAPFLIHWLTRPRPTRIPLSTVRFVLEIVQQRRSRSRLRDWIVLLCRAAAVILLALCLARPLTGQRAAAAKAAQENASTVRVVLLDVSQSMGATAGGIQAIERARPIAARSLTFEANTHANLILAAAAAQPVLDRPSTNFSALTDEIARARPLPQRIQVQEALNAAAEMLTRAGSELSRRELVVISDFQRNNWATADFSVLPLKTEIRLESVAPEKSEPNLGLVGVRPQGRVERGRPFRLEVEIENSGTAARPVSVDARIGEKTVRLQGSAAANGRSILVAETDLPTDGWALGEAKLVGIEDALAEDNSRPFVVHVHAPPGMLLLTRQPAGSKSLSSYFVERAILSKSGSGERDSAYEAVVRMDPARVDRETLQAADLILLDHPGKLPEPTVDLIAALLHRGRGLLYVSAEPADAVNLKRLEAAAGSGLQMPVEFSPPPAGAQRRNLFLSDIRRRQPPFTIFGDEATALFSSLRFDGGLATRPVAGALAEDVPARFNDQSAGLVVTACGAGALAILNAELKNSTLPASPAFVPLMGELVTHLLGRDRAEESVQSGEPLAAALPPSASPLAGLRIEPVRVDPARVGGAAPGADLEVGSLGELREDVAGILWQSPAAGVPGVYAVKRADATVFALASALPAEESDLETLASDVLTTRLAGGRDVTFHSGLPDDEPRDRIWSWLAVACVGFLLAEMGSLIVFRS
ncbi:vWA domain-containing protein [Planctomyces sp. SH-PL14]|uniref:vWA domain-containing protein n=1 Tax=Planctomyces sp. SH-PL14 TaxID=1632864 RepID=UPI00078DD328|nr:BatA and WFA domain-containing protein [Planctomyces sp. SH-PL14]AMV20530.1 hypothetical protein VT03_21710 [Planctomyces sp. SH-PL14]